MSNPRIVAIAATIVGLLLILQGLLDLVFRSGPVHVSSPVPGLADWFISKFGSRGVRIVGDLTLLAGGLLMIFAGRRFLRAKTGQGKSG